LAQEQFVVSVSAHGCWLMDGKRKPWGCLKDETKPGKGNRSATLFKTLVEWGQVGVHKWPDKSNVKVPLVGFNILQESFVKDKELKDLQLSCRYAPSFGLHIVKIRHRDCINDIPAGETKLQVGDRIFVLFETRSSSAIEASSNAELKPMRCDAIEASSNTELKLAALRCFFEIGDNERLTLADRQLWPKGFELAVSHFCLDSTCEHLNLKHEPFGCVELTFPRDAPPAWIGSDTMTWKCGDSISQTFASERPIPEPAELSEFQNLYRDQLHELRALNCRFNFLFSPTMVWKNRYESESDATIKRAYVCPALPNTILAPGDVVLVVPPGDKGCDTSLKSIELKWKWDSELPPSQSAYRSGRGLRGFFDPEYIRGLPRVFDEGRFR